APALCGPVEVEGLNDIDALWRPLFLGLAQNVPVSWRALGEADRGWFPGAVEIKPPVTPKRLKGEVCADPRAEVVEAMRWVRELLSRGDVKASDVALATAAPATWDDHVLVLA